MKKTKDRFVAEKIVQSIRQKYYKKTSPESYIKRLEKLLTDMAERQFALRKIQNESFDYYKQISRALPSINKKVLDMFDISIESIINSVKDASKIRKLETDISKYRGRKISPENEKLYDEIEQTDKQLQADGAQGSYSEATRIVAHRHKRHHKRLYESFMKWKNKPK